MDDSELLQALKEPFDPRFIKWRVGSTNKEKTQGIALAYIDAREVMKRLDDVFGVTGWQSEYTHVTDRGVVCRIGGKIGDEWVWKSNGAGETDFEGEKGAMSDAFKRAAVLWGIGRYLYYLPNEWVAIAQAGKSWKLTGTPKLPHWALPGTKKEPEISEESVVEVLDAPIPATNAKDERSIKERIADINDLDVLKIFWAGLSRADAAVNRKALEQRASELGADIKSKLKDFTDAELGRTPQQSIDRGGAGYDSRK